MIAFLWLFDAYFLLGTLGKLFEVALDAGGASVLVALSLRMALAQNDCDKLFFFNSLSRVLTGGSCEKVYRRSVNSVGSDHHLQVQFVISEPLRLQWQRWRALWFPAAPPLLWLAGTCRGNALTVSVPPTADPRCLLPPPLPGRRRRQMRSNTTCSVEPLCGGWCWSRL